MAHTHDTSQHGGGHSHYDQDDEHGHRYHHERPAPLASGRASLLSPPAPWPSICRLPDATLLTIDSSIFLAFSWYGLAGPLIGGWPLFQKPTSRSLNGA